MSDLEHSVEVMTFSRPLLLISGLKRALMGINIAYFIVI